MPKQQVFYSDFDIKFDAHPISGKIKLLNDNDAISQALKILILTDKYERLMQPNIFTDVRATLFENFTSSTALILDDFIRNATRNHERRANILKLEIFQRDDYNEIGIKLYYNGINASNPVVVTLFLRKLR